MRRRDASRRIFGLVTAVVMGVVQPALACSTLCRYHSLMEGGSSHSVMHEHGASCAGPMISRSGVRIASVLLGMPREEARLAVPDAVGMDWHLPYARASLAPYGERATPPPRA